MKFYKKTLDHFSQLIPITKQDLKKFIPMAIMMFLILLSQNIIRVVKDSLVSLHVGPQSISFIKLYLEMPSGMLFFIIYAKMCNKMSTEKVFRCIFSFFMISFIVMAFLVMPNNDKFHPDPNEITNLVNSYPFLRWFLEIYGKWSFVLLYVLGELYPMVVFTLLFWHLANKITTTEESIRIYPFLGVFGHTNLLLCKPVVNFFSNENFLFNFFSGNNDELVIKSLVTVSVFCGGIILLLHLYIDKTIVSNPNFISREINKPLSLSLRESIKIILKSRYLGLIALLSISYSMSVNLIEGTWMAKTKELYPNNAEFMQYQSKVLFITGCSTLIISLLSNYTLRRFGWITAALCPPIAILIGGSLFYLSILSKDLLYLVGINSSLWFIVMMGGFQNAIGKGAKYSLFDDTKEMAYIPLNLELKTKGKAAVDIIGGKIGKASGAVIQFIAFTLFPYCDFDDLALYLFICFVIVCSGWIYAVYSLSTEYKKTLSKN